MDNRKTESQGEVRDLEKIASMTPFTTQDLSGRSFRKGNMLGGANPVIEGNDPTGSRKQD